MENYKTIEELTAMLDEFEKAVRQRSRLGLLKAIELFKTFTDNEELVFLFRHSGNWFRHDQTDVVMNARLAVNTYGLWQSNHPLVVEFRGVIEKLRIEKEAKYIQKIATSKSLSPEVIEELTQEHLDEIKHGQNHNFIYRHTKDYHRQ